MTLRPISSIEKIKLISGDSLTTTPRSSSTTAIIKGHDYHQGATTTTTIAGSSIDDTNFDEKENAGRSLSITAGRGEEDKTQDEVEHDPHSPSVLLSPSAAIENSLNEIGIGYFHLIFLVCVGIVFGAESGQIFMTTFIKKKVEAEFNIGTTDTATMATVFFAGMGTGAIVFGWLSDAHGRRISSIAALAFCAVFGAVSSLSPDFVFLEFALGLVGFGCGGGFVIVALFMELLPANKRELWVSICYSMWTWGALLQCMWAYILRDESWRWLTLATAAPLILCLLCSYFIPESPRYMLMKGDNEGALRLIQRISKVNGKQVPLAAEFICSGLPDAETESARQRQKKEKQKGESTLSTGSSMKTYGSVEDEEVDTPKGKQKKELSSAVAKHKKNSGGALRQFKQIFDPSVRRLTFSMWVVWGGIAMSYYGIIMLTTSVFLNAGGEGFLAAAISSCGELPAYPLIKISTQKMGRKLPLIIFPVFTAALLILFFFVLQPKDDATVTNWKFDAEMVLVFIIRLLMLLTFDIAYMFSPEAFPTVIRTTGTGACSAVARATSMLCPFIAYPLAKADPVAPYIVFAVSLVIVSIGGYFIPFDTKGKAMDDDVPTTSGEEEGTSREPHASPAAASQSSMATYADTDPLNE